MKNNILFIFIFMLIFLLIVSCASTSVLNTGIAENDINLVKEAIDSGEDVNLQGRGIPPLNSALMRGRWEIAKYLIESGADVNKPNARVAVYPVDGLTPLMIASAWGNTEIVRMLIEKGANVNAVDKNRYSVLMHACSPKTNLECLDLLIDYGADINYKVAFKSGPNDYSADIFTVCALEYRQDLINFFISKGLRRNSDTPIVGIGYGVSNQGNSIGSDWYQSANSNDQRFQNNNPYYGGKLPQNIFIWYIDGEKWQTTRNYYIGEVPPGKHEFQVRYYTSEGYAFSGGSTTVRSDMIHKTFECNPNTIYVFHPILFQKSIQIQVYEFEL